MQDHGMIPIVDPEDPRLDAFRSMRARESRDVLWAEGPTVVERLFATSLTVRAVLLSPTAHARLEAVVRTTPAPVFVAEQPLINEVVGFDLHRGAIAVADRPTPTPLDVLLERLGARSTVVV